jgi:4-hydroxy-tetrahydrodipicolinate reductase
VIGAGINPGFVLDLVPIFFAGACVGVTGVEARRVMDLRPYGDTVHEMYGIGLSEAEFRAKVDDDTIGLHREIVQSVHMVADALGIELESVEEQKLPILEDGRTVGFRHVCHGRPGIEMELQGIFLGDEDGHTTVTIKGDPDVTVTMSGGLTNQGGRVVAARVVHMLPWLADAPAGLRSPVELPLALGAGLA